MKSSNQEHSVRTNVAFHLRHQHCKENSKEKKVRRQSIPDFKKIHREVTFSLCLDENTFSSTNNFKKSIPLNLPQYLFHSSFQKALNVADKYIFSFFKWPLFSFSLYLHHECILADNHLFLSLYSPFMKRILLC